MRPIKTATIEEATRRCDAPGCTHEGAYKAPQSREALTTYYWFCLDHVRAYNAQWNFYAGMQEEEIEAYARADATWDRPTWPLGERTGGFSLFENVEQAFHAVFSERAPSPSWQRFFPREEVEALHLFELSPPLTQLHLKERYKHLVKTHHPDHKNGAKESEEFLKRINGAYLLLKNSPRIPPR